MQMMLRVSNSSTVDTSACCSATCCHHAPEWVMISLMVQTWSVVNPKRCVLRCEVELSACAGSNRRHQCIFVIRNQ